ncbi:MAG: hypothetical protein WBD50_08020 [Candidatus Rhabdochlamydia sp.]
MTTILKSIEEKISISTEMPVIINHCPTAEEITLLAKESLSFLPSCSESLANRVNNLNMSSDKITMGQGEYVVFQSGENKELSRKLFEQVYEILIQYSPTAIINSGSDKAIEMCKNRYELIQSKVQEIDPSLEVVFVPRTLYELFFIRKCIREDIKHKKICCFVIPSAHKDLLAETTKYNLEYITHLKEIRETKKCWHLCCFDDDGDNKHTGVKDVAYRLNQVIVQTLSPSKNGFTYQEISEFAEKEISFLKDLYQQREKIRSDINDLDSFTQGPTISFTQELNYGAIKAMGIRNDADAQIIREAIRLECSDTAKYFLFLYRGGNFQKDFISHYDKKIPYSRSYGTSLFAGCVYDVGATAFHYMRNQPNGYAIPVPFDQLNTSVFYIPPLHTVAQLFGKGDFFHARTKVWQGFNPHQELRGVMASGKKNQRECLKSDLSKDDLTTLFQKYKSTAIQLKTA